jgi:D-arabinose 5-phosphate isomerase GutQ
MPTNADGLLKVGRVAAASGAACVEVLGALPVSTISPARIVNLCADAKPLVEAGAALDAALKQGAAGASAAAAASASSAAAKPADIYDAWVGSVLKDGDALSDAASHYTLNLAAATTAVNSLVTALASASSAAPRSSVVYTSGIGKSAAVAARLALSLRSIGIRASFVHGAEWSHGDLGAAGPEDVVVFFSNSGKTPELVDAAQRLKARGVRIFSVTSDGASGLSKLSVAHFRAPSTGELLGAIPTCSIVAQESVCNAAITATARALNVTKEKFQENHPGGSIGAAKA